MLTIRKFLEDKTAQLLSNFRCNLAAAGSFEGSAALSVSDACLAARLKKTAGSESAAGGLLPEPHWEHRAAQARRTNVSRNDSPTASTAWPPDEHHRWRSRTE